MSTIRARVRALEGDQAWVEVAQGCGRCQEEGGCGGQSLTQIFCSGPKRYLVRNEPGAAVGDEVRVAVSQGSIRQAANLAYVLPIGACLGGAIVGEQLAGDVAAMLGGVVGLVAGFALQGWRGRRLRRNDVAQPYILSRLNPAEEKR